MRRTCMSGTRQEVGYARQVGDNEKHVSRGPSECSVQARKKGEANWD